MLLLSPYVFRRQSLRVPHLASQFEKCSSTMSSESSDEDAVNVDLSSNDEEALLRTPGRDRSVDSEGLPPTPSPEPPKAAQKKKKRKRKVVTPADASLGAKCSASADPGASAPTGTKRVHAGPPVPRSTPRVIVLDEPPRNDPPTSAESRPALSAAQPGEKGAKRPKLSGEATGDLLLVQSIPLPPEPTMGDLTADIRTLGQATIAIQINMERHKRHIMDYVKQMEGKIRERNDCSTNFLNTQNRERAVLMGQKLDHLATVGLQSARAHVAHNEMQEAFNQNLRNAINHSHNVLQSILDTGLTYPTLELALKDMRDKIIRTFRNAARLKAKTQAKEAGVPFLPTNFWGQSKDDDDDQGK
jgi:hypothetical protein